MLSQKHAASAIRVPLSREPVPSWVEHTPYAIPSVTDELFVSDGLFRLLQDFQTNLSGAEIACHTRIANRVLTEEGAAAAAYVSTDFDPYYQRLEIHHVRVLRNGKVIDCSNLEAFRIQRREQDSERRSIDGRLTASMTIPDVQLGDVVEVCLTVYGSHPVLKGHFSSWVAIQGIEPVLDLRHRIRHGKDKTLAFHRLNDAPPPVSLRNGGFTEYVWRTDRPKGFAYEPLSPPWVIQGAVTQISDGASWADIAALFGSLNASETLPPDLQEEIGVLAREHPSAAGRAAEALRFVQRRLRHLPLPFNESNLALRPLAEVWSAGYGDCKDAARLYTAIARALKLDACPSLVSTSHGTILPGLLPAVNVFDHCIVRVNLEDKTYWLDPSLRPQSGDLNILVQPYRGYALPLSQEGEGLEEMNGASPVIVTESNERIELGPDADSPAKMQRKTVYSCWRADHIRDAMAREGEEAISAATLTSLRTGYSDATEHAPLRTEDEPRSNKLTLFESYKLPLCWRKTEGATFSFGTHDTVISRELAMLPAGPRNTDIHLGRPRVVRRYVHLHMPKPWKVTSWDRKLEMHGLLYRSKLYRKNKQHLVFAQLLAITAETAPPTEAWMYNEIVRTIGEQCDLTLVAAASKNGEIHQQRQGFDRLTLAAFGLFAIAAALGVAGGILFAG